MSKQYDVIMCLPDFHSPWGDFELVKEFATHIKFFKKTKKKVKIIQMGDLIDAKAWSKYSKDADDYSPQAEWDAVVEDMEKLHKLLPEMTILEGNHCIRPMRKAMEVMLPRQMIRGLAEMFPYKGWNWHIGPKPFVCNDIIFMHGDEMGGSAVQKAQRLGKSVVIGHTHKASLVYINTFQHQIFAVESGHAADPDGKGLAYAAKNPVTCWAGYVVIENNTPYLIPKS